MLSTSYKQIFLPLDLFLKIVVGFIHLQAFVFDSFAQNQHKLNIFHSELIIIGSTMRIFDT